MIRTPVVGEFAGTFVMMLLGGGVNAGILLKKTKSENAGWLALTTGWALAVLCGIFTANLFGSADAHLNPAITIAFAIKGGDFSRILPFFGAQVAATFTASIVVWLFFLPHWKVTEDQATKLGVFCTGPAIRSYGSNLLSEVIGTFTLIVVVGSISSKLVLTTGAVSGLSPLLVGCVVFSIGLSLGATTGYAINPARDFGPRLAHALLPIAGKGGSDWSYAWIPVLGPTIGGGLAGLLLRAVGA